MSTDDLLYLLANFGRQAPAEQCGQDVPAAPDLASINTVEDAQNARTYLFCALRDRVADATDQMRAECDAQLASYNETEANRTATAVLESEQNLLSVHDNVVANLAAAHETALASALSEKDAIIANLQNRLTTFHCSHISLPNGEISGDTTYGGSGVDFSCRAGFELQGVSHAECTGSGDWDIPWQQAPSCVLVNPCDANEDDCDSDATCAHTAPGQHTCECNEGFTGNGQRCSPCSACPDGFLLTSLCTSTADTVCTDPCESVPCVAGTCDRETATCVCEDGWIGSACATPDPCSQGLDASGNPGGPWIELVNANDMTPSTVIDGAYWGSRCDAGPTVTPTDFVMWVKMGQVNDYFRVRYYSRWRAPPSTTRMDICLRNHCVCSCLSRWWLLRRAPTAKTCARCSCPLQATLGATRQAGHSLRPIITTHIWADHSICILQTIFQATAGLTSRSGVGEARMQGVATMH